MFEEAYTQAGPVKIHYKQIGAGKPLLLLHGWGGQADSFAPVALAFSGSRQVYAIDFPGFGQSDIPPKSWDVTDYMNCLEGMDDGHGACRMRYHCPFLRMPGCDPAGGTSPGDGG